VLGKWHSYPIQAAAGLWCTARDLAKFSLAVLRAWGGEAGAVLSKVLCEQYLSEQQNAWGLGPRLFIQEGKTIGFHHGGANEGYRCNTVTFLDGRGAVVMTNGDQGDPLLGEIMAAAAEVYDWPECHSKEREWLPLSVEDQARFTGVFILNYENETYETHIYYKDQGLAISCPIAPFPNPFYCISQEEGSAVFMNSSGARVQFSKSNDGESVVTIVGNAFIRQESTAE
jgi:hypothetical protein